jgi:hypothetical protein
MTCIYCEKPVLAKQMCSMHYTRQKNHGSPFIVKSPRGQAQTFIYNIEKSDACIFWPFSHYRNGYGSVFFNGKLTGAHRAICIIYNGNPPSQKHHAAHLCGARNCVNPRHIRWATPAENELDKRLHGTASIGEMNPMAKLNKEEVKAIKKLKGQIGAKAVSNIYNCSRRLISAIWNGDVWAHID